MCDSVDINQTYCGDALTMVYTNKKSLCGNHVSRCLNFKIQTFSASVRGHFRMDNSLLSRSCSQHCRISAALLASAQQMPLRLCPACDNQNCLQVLVSPEVRSRAAKLRTPVGNPLTQLEISQGGDSFPVGEGLKCGKGYWLPVRRRLSEKQGGRECKCPQPRPEDSANFHSPHMTAVSSSWKSMLGQL